MKVALIGFMGSGKSTVSLLVADALGLEHIELDDDLVRLSSFSSIPEIFNEKGEHHFRELETKACEHIRERNKVIVSCGGGVIEKAENLAHLKANNGIVVYLETSFEEVKNRITEIESRPLFRDEKKAKQLFDRRLELYTAAADYTVNTDGKTIEAVASEVVAICKEL